MATPLNKMGSNMVKVFGRLKKQLDTEPALDKNGYPSIDWVYWYMRQHDVPRQIAVNKAYELHDLEKRKALYKDCDLVSYKNANGVCVVENDAGLRVLGITRLQDYYFMGGALLRRTLSHNNK